MTGVKKHNREQVAVLKWWTEFKDQERTDKSELAMFLRLELESRFPFLKENGYAQ